MIGRMDGHTDLAPESGGLDRRVVSLGIVAVGTVAAGVGLGLGPAWLTKAGLGLVSFAGIGLMVVGLGTTVVGLVRLWRAGGRLRWRVPAVVLAAVAVLAVSTSLAIAVAANTVPPTALGERTPSDLGLGFQDVSFPTADGVTLSAWFIPGESGAAIVLVHGAGNTRSGVLDHAAVLARHGYGVLLFDARGHGLSGGRAMDLGWYGDLDVGAAVTYLSTRDDVEPDRIGAIGLSMGGEEVIGAAGSDPRIAAVVAEGATNRVAADKIWQSEVYGARGALQEWLDRLTYGLADLLTPARPPVPLAVSMERIRPRPVLLIAAGDVPDEGHVAERLQAVAPDATEVWVVPGSPHVGALATDPGGWEERVVGFLESALNR